MLRRLLLWLLVAAIMAAIFCFSAQTGQESAAVSEPFSRLTQTLFSFVSPLFPSLSIDDFDAFVVFTRKAAHFFCYASLAASAFFAFSCDLSQRKSALFSFLLSVLYAVSDEWHQSFVPERAMQAQDVLLDSFGAVCGILLCLLCVRLARRTRARKKNGTA